MPAKKKGRPAAKSTAKKKTVAKKASVKKASTRKTVAKTAKKAKNSAAIRSALNKSQLLNELSDSTELSRKQINSVFEELGGLMHRHLKKGGAGEFTLPGVMKCVIKRKPATKARKGVNPFTGEMITFKAKPARNVVKLRALKKLKEMVE